MCITHYRSSLCCGSARIATLIGIVVLLGAGCNLPPHEATEEVKAEPPERAYTIHVNRRDASPSAEERSADGSSLAQPRRLVFEVAGTAGVPADSTREQRAAAREAAIIDALCRALMEARRSRGEPTAEFTVRIGPRLKVTRRQMGATCQIEADLIAHGIEHQFVVRDGVLQHLPHDTALIHRIFEETGGRFALLPGSPNPPSDKYVATIGCYVPITANSVTVVGDGDVTAEDVDPVEP